MCLDIQAGSEVLLIRTDSPRKPRRQPFIRLPLRALQSRLRIGDDFSREESQVVIPLALVKEDARRSVARRAIEESGSKPCRGRPRERVEPPFSPKRVAPIPRAEK